MSDIAVSETALAEGGPTRPVLSRSFLGLLAVQFLGSMNDNVFRWLAVPFGKTAIDPTVSLALGLACFTVPYLLLATVAGHFADRFAKRKVIVLCKFAEIVVMALGVWAFLAGNVVFLFAVVAIMGAQSALFAPAKFGAIAEIVDRPHLSLANGLMGMASVVASATGFVVGNLIYGRLGQPRFGEVESLAEIGPAAVVLLGVAFVGWAVSTLIRTGPAADPDHRLTNPLADTARQTRLLVRDLPLFRTALGIAFFWMLASLVQLTVDPYGTQVLGLEQEAVGILGGVLIAGVGLGSVIAGVWSGKAVELGIVPIGAAGVAASSILLYVAGSGVDPGLAATAQPAWYWSLVWLFTLGASAGLFNVPLNAFLQHRSPTASRGSILAAANFVSFTFILASAGLLLLLQNVFAMSADQVFLVAGLGTLPVLAYIVFLIPDATIRCIVWLVSQLAYRIRVYGRENIPEEGGGLLVANHVSWLDGILIPLVVSRPVRMIAYADFVYDRKLRPLMNLYKVIPIKADGGPKELVRSLQTAREAVQNGELVCIFAEGGLTRTGQTQRFQKGLLRIVRGTDAPVVPVYLDELWGSIFSFRGGRFFWKWPRKWPYPISINFGTPMPEPEDVEEVRQAVLQLSAESALRRKRHAMLPQRRLLRQCKKSLFRSKVADSAGTELTGGRLLAGTLMFRRLLKGLLAPDEKTVGVLLPPSVGGTLANAAVALLRKVAVNLNYTLAEETVNDCIREAGIRHVLTSRKFMERKPYDLDAEVVYLEDLKDRIGLWNKVVSLFAAYAVPSSILDGWYGLRRIKPDDLLTIIFTSGSTGQPKGVMLSHYNVQSNVEAVDDVFSLGKEDVLLGILPTFHSFGYTVGLWLPLALDPSAVYHYNPLDGRTVGKLSQKYGVSILVSTPTFLRTYTKRCTPEQFEKLDVVIVGAEKLPRDVAEAFREKFGVMPSEGYGTTELSPAAAVNIPDHRSTVTQIGTKFGTVGRPLPGTTARVVDPDTRDPLGTNQEGILEIKGPNVMLGYLNMPEKTAEVVHDGWYHTGDMALIDEDGFITITGRLNRFSKIGGEMVPHLRVEQILNDIAEQPDDEEAEPLLAVTSVPDEKKGERLVVLHRPLPMPVDEILRRFDGKDVPNLWIPDRENFVEVDEIPHLGTGKLDLRGLQQLALERCGNPAAAS